MGDGPFVDPVEVSGILVFNSCQDETAQGVGGVILKDVANLIQNGLGNHVRALLHVSDGWGQRVEIPAFGDQPRPRDGLQRFDYQFFLLAHRTRTLLPEKSRLTLKLISYMVRVLAHCKRKFFT